MSMYSFALVRTEGSRRGFMHLDSPPPFLQVGRWRSDLLFPRHVVDGWPQMLQYIRGCHAPLLVVKGKIGGVLDKAAGGPAGQGYVVVFLQDSIPR